jgi:hypothetical protein
MAQLSSIGVRIPLIVIIAISASLGFVGYQDKVAFQKLVKNQQKSVLIGESSQLNSNFQQRINQHKTNLKGIFQEIVQFPPLTQKAQLQTSLNKNKDYFSLHFYKAGEGTAPAFIAESVRSNLDPKIYKDRTVEQLFEKVAKHVPIWLEAEIKQRDKATFFISSIASKVDWPFVVLAIKEVSTIDQAAYWLVVTIPSETFKPLFKTISPDSINAQQIVLDSNGQVFASLDAEKVKNATRYDSIEIVSLSMRSQKNISLFATYHDWNRVEWVGAITSNAESGLLYLNQIEAKKLFDTWDAAAKQTLGGAAAVGLIALLLLTTVLARFKKRITAVTELASTYAKGNFDTEIRVRAGSDDLSTLIMSLNVMSDNIKKVVVQNGIRLRSRLMGEVASAFQSAIDFPKDDFSNQYVRIFAHVNNVNASGGEWLLYEPLGDGRVFVGLGNASTGGLKGAFESALVCNLVKHEVRTHAAHPDELSPSKIMHGIGSLLQNNFLQDSTAMHVFLGVLNPFAAKMVYANYGAHSPVIITSAPPVPPSRKTTYSANKLVSHRMRTGDGNDPLIDQVVDLKTGDRIVYYVKSVADSSKGGVTRSTVDAMLEHLIAQSSEKGESFKKKALEWILATGDNIQTTADYSFLCVECSKFEVRPEKQESALSPEPAAEAPLQPPSLKPPLPAALFDNKPEASFEQMPHPSGESMAMPHLNEEFSKAPLPPPPLPAAAALQAPVINEMPSPLPVEKFIPALQVAALQDLPPLPSAVPVAAPGLPPPVSMIPEIPQAAVAPGLPPPVSMIPEIPQAAVAPGLPPPVSMIPEIPQVAAASTVPRSMASEDSAVASQKEGPSEPLNSFNLSMVEEKSAQDSHDSSAGASDAQVPSPPRAAGFDLSLEDDAEQVVQESHSAGLQIEEGAGKAEAVDRPPPIPAHHGKHASGATETIPAFTLDFTESVAGEAENANVKAPAPAGGGRAKIDLSEDKDAACAEQEVQATIEFKDEAREDERTRHAVDLTKTEEQLLAAISAPSPQGTKLPPPPGMTIPVPQNSTSGKKGIDLTSPPPPPVSLSQMPGGKSEDLQQQQGALHKSLEIPESEAHQPAARSKVLDLDGDEDQGGSLVNILNQNFFPTMVHANSVISLEEKEAESAGPGEELAQSASKTAMPPPPPPLPRAVGEDVKMPKAVSDTCPEEEPLVFGKKRKRQR